MIKTDLINKNNLISLSAFLMFCLILRLDILLGGLGSDANVFCRAGEAIHQGKNPYFTSVLGTFFSWNYPSVLAHGFYVVCSWFGFEDNYYLFYSLFLFLALAPWLDRRSWFYGITLCITGLYSFGWVITTGNISTIEFFVFSLFMFFLIKGKYDLSFFLLGLTASIKITPIFYVPIFLFFMKTLKEKARAVFFTGVGFLLLIFISAVINIDLMPWYFKQLFGLIPGQHAAFTENTGGIFSPFFSSMVLSFLGLESINNLAVLTLSFLFFVSGFFLSMYLFKKVNPGITSQPVLETAIGCCVIIFTLVMPRLKPYSFLPALLSFYIVSRNQSKSLQSIYIVLLSVIPNFLYLTNFYFDKTKFINPGWLLAFLLHLFQVIQAFNQTFFLFFATVLLLISIRKKTAQNAHLEVGSEGIEERSATT